MVLRLTVAVVSCPCDTVLPLEGGREPFHRQQSRRFGNIGTVARRKLRMLDDAEKLEDMGAVPGGRLESLGGDTQSRICFIWRKGAAESVEIVDYH